MDKSLKILKSLIKELKEKGDIKTQKKFAEKVGVHFGSLSAILNERLPFSKSLQFEIIQAFDLDPYYFDPEHDKQAEQHQQSRQQQEEIDRLEETVLNLKIELAKSQKKVEALKQREYELMKKLVDMQEERIEMLMELGRLRKG